MNMTTETQSTQDPLIVRLLATLNRLEPDRLESLYRDASHLDIAFEELAIDRGVADERFIAEAYAKHYLMPTFDPPRSAGPPPINAQVAALLPADLCRQHRIAPLSDDGRTLEVAIFSPDSLVLADQIKWMTGRQMRPLFTKLSVIRQLISMLYGDATTPLELPSIAPEQAERWTIDGSPAVTSSPAASEYFDRLIGHAIGAGSTELHLQTQPDGWRVRLRGERGLVDFDAPSSDWSDGLIRQLKTLGDVQTPVMGLPGEGRFQLCRGEKVIDVRLHCLPTMNGEKIALRLIDRDDFPDCLLGLALDDTQRKHLCTAIAARRGLVLVTGPSGSGKSTTMAACLGELADGRADLCSIEETIDRPIAGVHQIQTLPEQGLSVATALRAVIRQNVDAIAISEIDGHETARLVLREATGSRLIVGVMTEADGLAALRRFIDWDVPAKTLHRGINVVVNQRRVRRLCDACKRPHAIEPELSRRFGIDADQTIYRAGGCTTCDFSGYRGRMTLFEVIRISRRIIDVVQSDAPAAAFRQALVAEGVKLIRQSAVERIVAGETSLQAAFGV